ncbi:alpha/beta hydrolase [Massilia glaciei]|uniref:Alpha/beta hydrolase n=1 Tax=Massilia glaciei TaxID=1524097 RepID=A0A2U2HJV6_9BURK|nr:alpha/beta hydrolase [Massilia glaciei]
MSNSSPARRGVATPLLIGAAALGAAFLVVRRQTAKAERNNPPRGKFIEVDGVRLHYLEFGRGPALVLLHGNGVLANDFELCGLVERAARKYRVILFDRPGYGYSERPRSTIWTPVAQANLLHKALGQIGVEAPIVLGHSWGTLVAVAMAIAQPAHVRGLVLLSGYYFPTLRLDVPLLAQPAIPIIGDLMRFTLSPLVGRLMWPSVIKKMFGPLSLPERFRRLPVWMVLRPSQLRASAAEAAMMVPAAMMLKKHYPELAVPVKIIAGEQDRVADAGHQSGRLHEQVPGSDLHLEPGTGHMIHYATPDDIIAAIDELSSQAGPPEAPPPFQPGRAQQMAQAASGA